MKKLIFSIIAFLSTLVLLVVVIQAYFSDKKQTSDINMTIGEIEYNLSGSFLTGYIMPGVNLIDTPITLDNISTIDTELRVSVKVASAVFGTESLEDMIGSDFYTLGEGWRYDETDEKYYYEGLESTLEEGAYIISPDSEIITLLSYLELDGYKFSNNHALTPLSFTFSFEAKQGHFVDWETLGEVNYQVNP
ncbi:hypothetical protein JN09_000963 [Acholeplasma morum]|uniref:hypothetical protein n=1 Tax=Paracholeplasma morum TaxID=264637 RepID=UPI0019563D86|nr:hypothetical protein [Paracholeplasma morum]MBM7453631.1 hypothetical protein [Paracholeplasma morum]